MYVILSQTLKWKIRFEKLFCALQCARAECLSSCLQLGVNGYAFAVTSHGYVLFHPDFRPFVSWMCVVFFIHPFTLFSRSFFPPTSAPLSFLFFLHSFLLPFSVFVTVHGKLISSESQLLACILLYEVRRTLNCQRHPLCAFLPDIHAIPVPHSKQITLCLCVCRCDTLGTDLQAQTHPSARFSWLTHSSQLNSLHWMSF